MCCSSISGAQGVDWWVFWEGQFRTFDESMEGFETLPSGKLTYLPGKSPSFLGKYQLPATLKSDFFQPAMLISRNAFYSQFPGFYGETPEKHLK